MKCLFKGSGTALITPFDQNGINKAAFFRIVEHQIQQGTDALVVCGTTGEPCTMSDQEKATAIEYCVEAANGRVPVIAGTGVNCTADVIQESRTAQRIGADGLLIVTPYYNKATQKGLIAHYTMVADAVDLPIILYNVPARTSLNMTPDTLYALAQHPNIYGMKEASGNITQMALMCEACADLIAMYCGNDDHVLPLLSLGGMGAISVVGNVLPNMMHELVTSFLNGDLAKSRELQLKILPLWKDLFCEVNPIPVKTAMNLLGFEVGELRMPLTPMEEDNRLRLRETLKNYGLNPV
ncbi:MAG: 4-hydroxy-tetrahydrodipicolinate synthase [Christensenellales bacterium]|jgi:4-hydroxy-tetrahydrodipicolinate synthase